MCLCQSQSSNLFLLHFPLANKFVFYIYYVGEKPLPYYFIVVATMSRYSKKNFITQFHITYTRKTSIKNIMPQGKLVLIKTRKIRVVTTWAGKKKKIDVSLGYFILILSVWKSTLTFSIQIYELQYYSRHVHFTMPFSRSVVSNSLWPHGLQHARFPCPHHLPELAQTHVYWLGNAIQHHSSKASVLLCSAVQLYIKWNTNVFPRNPHQRTCLTPVWFTCRLFWESLGGQG